MHDILIDLLPGIHHHTNIIMHDMHLEHFAFENALQAMRRHGLPLATA
ncbi:hypothetical protein [Desulfocurvibacter africanus]|nr:hypothetical protein [Desulfocurvibacter africanus]